MDAYANLELFDINFNGSVVVGLLPINTGGKSLGRWYVVFGAFFFYKSSNEGKVRIYDNHIILNCAVMDPSYGYPTIASLWLLTRK